MMSSDASDRVIRLRPYQYIHVLNNNTNVSTVVVGPKTFVRKDHQEVILAPTAMINIPPRSYCSIRHPHVRSTNADAAADAADDASDVSDSTATTAGGGEPVSENGQVQLRHGDLEIRLADDWTEPFPLYPGEEVCVSVELLRVVAPNEALRVTVGRPFTGVDGKKRCAGDEYMFMGPGTYVPRVEVEISDTVVATTIKPNTALMLEARFAFTDRTGVARKAGDLWLIKAVGAYMPSVEENKVMKVAARVLTEKSALHLSTKHSFIDVYGCERKAGDEWLVTDADSQTHIADVHETVVAEVAVTTLSKQQYCVVLNPIDAATKRPRRGARETRRGEMSFFLHPGEELQNGIESALMLGEEEALLLWCDEHFVEELDGEAKERFPGSEWQIEGPRKYFPPTQVRVVEKRVKIPLDENEGIYVRNKKTGKVSTVKGETYMLRSDEVLWDKKLTHEVSSLLQQSGYRGPNATAMSAVDCVPWKLVTYRVPHNAAVQIFDYKLNKSRVVFGPELVMLDPDEEFTIVSLSAGIPKQPNQIKSLCLSLGPDFMKDSVVVETSDHARLKLTLSYNWAFLVDKQSSTAEAAKIFSVRDFIGDTCKTVASRVRGAVASTTFDNFHKHSADIIKQAVFGLNASGESNDQLLFSANKLSVTNVDIQSVTPVEQRTRDALQKSVQLAIEISTDSQEALANHEAMREEQAAQGMLERQKIEDQSASEAARSSLLELQAKTAAVESTGQAKAEAIATAEAQLIQGEAAVKQAELKAQAQRIRTDAQLATKKAMMTQEVEYRKMKDKLEIDRAEKEAKIEAAKFSNVIEALGADTITAIARAGPELQAQLLEGLGLEGFLVTDGNSPVNLFGTAAGLLGGNASK